MDIHQTFEVKGCTTDRDYIRVIWQSDNSNSWYCKLNIYSTINFTISDHNGDFIEDATITLTNDIDDEFTDVTDVNGELTLEPKTYTVEYDVADPDGYNYNSKTTDVNPLTITISKEGYIDYVSKIDVAGINNWEISLKAAELEPLKFTNIKIT